MIITDAQVHLWGPDMTARPWPKSGRSQPHRPQPFSAADCLKEMDAAGVARVVIVPPSWEGDRNDLAVEAAGQYPQRFAVMGRLALERPESRGLLDGWRRQPGMLGLRFTFGGAAQRPWLTDGTADWLWPALERAGLPVMLSVPGSLFWGTDLTRLPCTYRQAITLFIEELPWLSAHDQEWVMGRGIGEWLSWKEIP